MGGVAALLGVQLYHSLDPFVCTLSKMMKPPPRKKTRPNFSKKPTKGLLGRAAPHARRCSLAANPPSPPPRLIAAHHCHRPRPRRRCRNPRCSAPSCSAPRCSTPRRSAPRCTASRGSSPLAPLLVAPVLDARFATPLRTAALIDAPLLIIRRWVSSTLVLLDAFLLSSRCSTPPISAMLRS